MRQSETPRSGLLPGVTALSAQRQAVFAILGSVAACAAAAYVLLTLNPAGAGWIAAAVGSAVVILVGGLGSSAMLIRARRADRRETLAGYSTLYDNDFGFERRDPKSGKVVEVAKHHSAIGELARGAKDPIVGGAHSQGVRAGGTAWEVFSRDRIGQLQLIAGLAVEATFILLAVGSHALGTPNADGAQIATFCVSCVAAGVLPYFLVGNPFLRARGTFVSALRRELSAVGVWGMTPSGNFGALVHLLPLDGTAAASTGWSLFFVLRQTDLSFWTRRDSDFEELLCIPIERVRGVARSTSSLGPGFSGVRLSISANNGEIVELQFLPIISSWGLSPLLAGRVESSVKRVLDRP